MSAREYATQDIKASLKEHDKSFIAFRKELNPAINNIVKDYLKVQATL